MHKPRVGYGATLEESLTFVYYFSHALDMSINLDALYCVKLHKANRNQFTLFLLASWNSTTMEIMMALVQKNINGIEYYTGVTPLKRGETEA